MKRFLALILSFSFMSQAAIAGDAVDIDWSPENRPTIRDKMFQCEAFLSPVENGRFNDSVGIRLTSNKVEEVRADLSKLVSLKGREALQGSTLYVVGIEMANEKATEKAYQEMLSEIGFGVHELRIQVMSIPRPLAMELSRNFLAGIWERFKFFFPSLKRDYQIPTKDEVVSGLIADAFTELGNMAYLYHTLPPTDAALTLTVHTALIVSMTVYFKSLVNWLIRSGSFLGGFLKQMTFALPYVINYNIFANWTPLTDFYRAQGVDGLAAAAPEATAQFLATQSLTLFMHTMFYQIVMTKGLRGWQNAQSGHADSHDARTWANFLTIPPLLMQSVFLAMASNTGETLWQMGPLEVNTGHALIALITTAGSALWIWPEILNPTFTAYKSTRDALAKAADYSRNILNKWFKKPLSEE